MYTYYYTRITLCNNKQYVVKSRFDSLDYLNFSSNTNAIFVNAVDCKTGDKVIISLWQAMEAVGVEEKDLTDKEKKII